MVVVVVGGGIPRGGGGERGSEVSVFLMSGQAPFLICVILIYSDWLFLYFIFICLSVVLFVCFSFLFSGYSFFAPPPTRLVNLHFNIFHASV